MANTFPKTGKSPMLALVELEVNCTKSVILESCVHQGVPMISGKAVAMTTLRLGKPLASHTCVQIGHDLCPIWYSPAISLRCR